jgi:hypothetical protein
MKPPGSPNFPFAGSFPLTTNSMPSPLVMIQPVDAATFWKYTKPQSEQEKRCSFSNFMLIDEQEGQ